MLLIIITGNYNFFNLLTVVLCISLLINMDGVSRISSNLLLSKLFGRAYGLLKILLILSVYFGLVFYAIRLFGLKVAEDWTILSNISKHKFSFPPSYFSIS